MVSSALVAVVRRRGCGTPRVQILARFLWAALASESVTLLRGTEPPPHMRVWIHPSVGLHARATRHPPSCLAVPVTAGLSALSALSCSAFPARPSMSFPSSEGPIRSLRSTVLLP